MDRSFFCEWAENTKGSIDYGQGFVISSSRMVERSLRWSFCLHGFASGHPDQNDKR